MKRILKIIGITTASLVGLVLIVVCLACYVVFTPKRLTPIVDQVADSVLTCSHELEEVNLTFFSTFPYFGVEIKGLKILNPMDGAPSEMVLEMPRLVAGVDLMRAIDGDIHIRQCKLNDLTASLFIDSNGQSNFDILRLEEDTTTTDEPSTWKLQSIEMDEAVEITTKSLSLVNLRDSIWASIADGEVSLSKKDELVTLALNAEKVNCQLGEEQYASDLHLSLDLPIGIRNWEKQISLEDARLAINDMAIQLSGEVGIERWEESALDCDLTLTTNEWTLSTLMETLPKSMAEMMPREINANGKLQLTAHAYGHYDSICMPKIDARVRLSKGCGHYDKKVLPYTFDAIDADLEAHIDLNEKDEIRATIHRLYAKTGTTHVTLAGEIRDILRDSSDFVLDNPLCDIHATLDVNLDDANYWIASDEQQNHVRGRMCGTLDVKSRLDDITQLHYGNIHVDSKLAINGLDLQWADSTLAKSDKMEIELRLPKTHAKHKNNLTGNCKIRFDQLDASMENMGLHALLKKGEIETAIELNTRDTAEIPLLDASFQIADLNGVMDTMTLHTINPKGKIQYGTIGKSQSPKADIQFSASKLAASLGKDTRVSTDTIDIEAKATYRKEGENILLKWNPRLRFNVENGHAQVPSIDLPIRIPQIKFSYSNNVFQIDTSRIMIGKSDFSLGGNIQHLGKWLRHEGEMTGKLLFSSKHTDVDELLEIVNNFNQQTGATEEVKESETHDETKEADPFLVPERVNLTLTTNIYEADALGEHLKNLNGRLYVRDGIIVLEEMGFVCEAAKLQLTAMYKTPRRDHIYVGLDYHMVDIDLQQLIRMVPQLDTLVPMLSGFKGKAQFHIAAETFVNGQYKLKPSTLRGACSIEAKDLVVLDGETFDKISKILLFSKKTENKIDSLSTQITLYKDLITVYPFCLSMDNYMVAVGGNHFMDMSFNYHASLLKPFYIGVDVGGTLDKLDIKPAKCRYAQDFRPIIHKDTEARSAELRKIISSSLKKNVKIQSDIEKNKP